MTTKTKPKTITPTEAHTAAQADVAEWETALAEARVELDSIDTSPATTPAQARKTAEQTAGATAYVKACETALTAAVDRKEAAARVVVAAEADALEPELTAAREALAAFDAKTEDLLTPLREHTGRDWQLVDPIRAARAAGVEGPLSFPVPARHRLVAPLEALERRQQALRAAAQGIDPVTVCEAAELPDSLRPGGVCPSPSLAKQAAEQAAYASQLEAEQAAIDAAMAQAQERLDAACALLGVPHLEADNDGSADHAQRNGRTWRDKYALTMAPVDFDTARRQAPYVAALETIAVLASWEDADKAADALRTRSNDPNAA